MEAVSVERERAVGAIVQAFAAERTEILRSFELQRLATLEWATAERREAIAEVHRELAESIEALRVERAVVVNDVRHIVDAVLLRVAISSSPECCSRRSSLTPTPVSGRGDGATRRAIARSGTARPLCASALDMSATAPTPRQAQTNRRAVREGVAPQIRCELCVLQSILWMAAINGSRLPDTDPVRP